MQARRSNSEVQAEPPYLALGALVAAAVWLGIVFLALFIIPIAIVGAAGLLYAGVIMVLAGPRTAGRTLAAVLGGLVTGAILALFFVSLVVGG